MLSPSSSSFLNGDSPKKGGSISDPGSGATNTTAVHPRSTVASLPANVSSSSSTSGSNSPCSSLDKISGLWQKHPLPSNPSSGPSPPLRENSDNRNNLFNNIPAINTSAQSTMSSFSSAAYPPCMRNIPEPLQDRNNDDLETELEDSESSDVEIYLNSFDSNTTVRIRGPDSLGANSTKSNSIPALHPFRLSKQTKSGHTSIAQEHGIRDRGQENSGPDSLSTLGTYGNSTGTINAQTFNLVDGTRNSSQSFTSSNHIPSQEQQQQNVFHPSASALSVSPRDQSLPDLKGDTQSSTPSSLVDDPNLRIPQSTRTPNHPSSIAIDLAKLSINSNFAGSPPLTPVNAGSTRHQGQMGMSVSKSQPVDSGISQTPYTTLDGLFTSSASDPILCGISDGSNGSGSSCSANENSTISNGAGVVRSPNVYINGLTPHFPEDELFNLCCEFGPIRSVRTFTRLAKDCNTESGYGFVLFENVDDAESCIDEIRRRYKNLHPTFSKQIHKIPGTNYAVGPSTSWDGVGVNGNFKVQMESLHDPTSTNLYMEGLPLSIDEATLAALVSPHRIVSSRCFQTRLSDPPRTIAFVRLETRVGAEEVVERLHGRIVRGRNDPGGRIVVRFADSSKQRELRKEHASQETDTSSSRLTIAQAALLNLCGQDLRSGPKTVQLPHTSSLSRSSSSQGFTSSVSAPDFSSNGSLTPFGRTKFNLPFVGNNLGRTTPGPTLLGGGHSGVSEYPLGFGTNTALHSRSRSPYIPGYQTDQRQGNYAIEQFGLGREPVQDYNISSCLDPRWIPDDLAKEMGENFYSQNGGSRHPINNTSYEQQQLPVSQSVDSMLGQTYSRPSPVYTRSGYTPAEEYIMRAHAESATLAHAQHQQGSNNVNMLSYQPQHFERGRPSLALNKGVAESAGNIGVGMRACRAQASLLSSSAGTSVPSNLNANFGNFGEISNGEFSFMREADDSPPSAMLMALKNLQASRLSRELRPYQNSSPMSSFLPVSSVPTPSRGQPSLSATQRVSPNPNDAVLSAYQQQTASSHIRSTTLPQHRPTSTMNGHVRGHHQHNSMSIPKQNLGTPQHASVARLGSNSALVEGTSDTIYECDGHGTVDNSQAEVCNGSLGSGSHPDPSMLLKTHYSSVYGDSEQLSSPLTVGSSLISPTLTYGTQTPSTLSPPTPFFGSFSSNVEGFDKNDQLQQPVREMHEAVPGIVD